MTPVENPAPTASAHTVHGEVISGLVHEPMRVFVEPFGEDEGVSELGGFVAATIQRLRLRDRAIRSQVQTMKARSELVGGLQKGLESLQRLRGISERKNGEALVADDLHEAGLIDHPTDEAMKAFFEDLSETTGLHLPTSDSITIPPLDGDGDGMEVELPRAFNTEPLNSLVNELETRVTRLNSSSELDMINLQTTMESRSNELRLISQILQSENDSLKAIVGNIG